MQTRALSHAVSSSPWQRLSGLGLMLCLVCPAGFIPAHPAAAQSRTASRQSTAPLTVSALERSLRAGSLSSAATVSMIRRRGVNFVLNHDLELELRGAGADANIIEAVGLNYKGPVVQSANPDAVQAAPVTRTSPIPGSAPSSTYRPAFTEVTIPASTVLNVQMAQTLDSASAQTGQNFTGTLFSDVVLGDRVVLPHGAPVTGQVTLAKDATHFSGSSELAIQLSSVQLPGKPEPLPLVTDPVDKKGAGRGKSTATRTGVGAVGGAVLGGILGGGKGAAIGAASGGGLGAGTNAVSRGAQVQFPAEATVSFTLTSPLLVRVPIAGYPAPVDTRPVLNSPR